MATNRIVGSRQVNTEIPIRVSDAQASQVLIAFPTVARRLLKFEEFPLREQITNTLIQNVGSEAPILEPAAFGNGARLRPDTVLSMGWVPKDARQLSLGFWWSPPWLRPAVGQSDGLPAYYRTPVVSKSQYALDTVSGTVSAIETTFVLYEESLEDGENRMYILLQGTDEEQYIWSSPNYQTGIFHHFWMSFDAVQQRVSLYIDGIEQVLTQEQGTNAPEALYVNQSVQVRINESAVGKNSLLRKSFGLIDEFFIEDRREFDPNNIARHINFGSEYVYDSQLYRREKILAGFAFDDPSAITTSAAFSNGTNIYAGKTDGQVFKGDRLLWKARRDFANRDELDFVQSRFLAAESSVSVDNGALRVSKASVRL